LTESPIFEVPPEDLALLKEANSHISRALADGAASDPRLIEVLAFRIADMRCDVSEQLRLMLDAVRFFYISGQAFTGLPIAQRARTLAVESADAVASFDALLLVGVCAADTGGLSTAMEAYADALRLATGLEDKVRESRVWQNLGVALMYGGLYNEASNCFERVVLLARDAPNAQPSLAKAYTNLALCHLNLDEIRSGLLAIEKAAALSGEPKDAQSALNRVIIENNYTRLLLEADNFEGAKVHARLARLYAYRTKSPRADIFAAVAEGLAEVFSGQMDVGITRLTKTLDRAKILKVMAREVLMALVKALEFAGKPDQALVFLRQLLEQQSTTQKLNVLQHVKLHLEQLHPLIEDEANAIRRLTTREEVLEGRVAKQALFKAQVESMERIAVVAELRDDSTGAHSYRVGRLASLLAKECGRGEEFIFMVDIAARLHDIGKVGIPDGILLKPAQLNAAEREVMKTHTTIGAEVLANSNIAHMKTAEEIARYHHEWWDGTGYPSGLAGDAIPESARITALADVFDALTHKRPYKSAWPLDSTLTEIMSLRGRQFDPRLTDIFLALVAKLRREHDDLDTFLGEAALDSPFLQARDKIKETLLRSADSTGHGVESRLDLQR
jgi:putative two-component system response regulator